MTKYFSSSSLLLFLGDWISQVGLNWFVLTAYHNVVYLGLVNFCHFISILLLSVWAGSIADKYDKGPLLRITITSSFIITALSCLFTHSPNSTPTLIILLYATFRGILSAVETPVRQVVLSDLSSKIFTTQAISFHSFIINICRSIGLAIAGGLIAVYHTPITFLAQVMCYFIAAVLRIPIRFEVVLSQKEGKALPLKVVLNYFKNNLGGSQIFITSIIIMAIGLSYTTVLSVLTNHIFPGQSQVFGIVITFCAIGGIVVIIVSPPILKHLSTVKMYYLSSISFGIALLGTIIHHLAVMFICITLIGLFSQWARTINRVYFQHSVKDCDRGKVLSIIIMDRGMIPLGSLIASFFADTLGILITFITMGISTISISPILYIIQCILDMEESNNES